MMSDLRLHGLYTYGNPSPFPPSFDGSPLSYAFGLFGDVVTAALSLTVLLSFLLEKRRADKVKKHLGMKRLLPEFRSTEYSLYELHRLKHICIWLFVVCRSLPDALWMSLWAEVPERVIRFFLALDLVFDGIAMIPFLFALLFWAWSRQAIEQQLVEAPAGVRGTVPWDLVKQNGRIVILVLVVAVGVTIGKATG